MLSIVKLFSTFVSWCHDMNDVSLSSATTLYNLSYIYIYIQFHGRKKEKHRSQITKLHNVYIYWHPYHTYILYVTSYKIIKQLSSIYVLKYKADEENYKWNEPSIILEYDTCDNYHLKTYTSLCNFFISLPLILNVCKKRFQLTYQLH